MQVTLHHLAVSRESQAKRACGIIPRSIWHRGLRVDILRSNGGRAETSIAMTYVMLPKRIKLDFILHQDLYYALACLLIGSPNAFL
jgi:hypothetical protein